MNHLMDHYDQKPSLTPMADNDQATHTPNKATMQTLNTAMPPALFHHYVHHWNQFNQFLWLEARLMGGHHCSGGCWMLQMLGLIIIVIVDAINGQVVWHHGSNLIIFVCLSKLGIKCIPLIKEDGVCNGVLFWELKTGLLGSIVIINGLTHCSHWGSHWAFLVRHRFG